MEEKETLDAKVNESWKDGLLNWNSPSIPFVIAPTKLEEVKKLGKIGQALQGELAFMAYPEFQTYLNLERIASTLEENPEKGLRAISSHEIGHRFCPYDVVTSIILRHAIKKELEGETLPYSAEAASKLILNLFTDMCINTNLMKKGNQDLTWTYEQISRDKRESKLWRVYGKSMETTWNQKILPEDVTLSEEETSASQQIAGLFERDFFNKSKWKENARAYARAISKFLEQEDQDRQTQLDDCTGNIPKQLDDKIEQELAKRLAELGSDGLPTNPAGLKEFKEIMAGFGKGDPKTASITFYDRLSDSYNVMFATRPFGRPRINPFQPVKWTPSMGAERLDIDYSTQVGGKIIPGVNTYAWNTRRREAHGGFEEVIPDLDLYLDSSSSMPKPIEEISLPVLTGFVVAKKAHRKGAKVRATNFSGNGQSSTQDWTRDLSSIFGNLVTHYAGGTVFPVDKLLEGEQPRQVLVITDTFLGNEEEAATAIHELRQKNKSNRATIYALHPVDRADYLRNAGAEVIHGTTTDIFKRAIGKADEVYVR